LSDFSSRLPKFSKNGGTSSIWPVPPMPTHSVSAAVDANPYCRGNDLRAKRTSENQLHAPSGGIWQ
jgi:hypothetical protein